LHDENIPKGSIAAEAKRPISHVTVFINIIMQNYFSGIIVVKEYNSNITFTQSETRPVLIRGRSTGLCLFGAGGFRLSFRNAPLAAHAFIATPSRNNISLHFFLG
jgi:hypothetical protein